MKFAQDVIIEPVITEHSMAIMRNQRKYTFIVAKNANKIEIRDAVEKLFKVSVSDVNTMNMRGKKRKLRLAEGRTPSRKKAIVTLTKDSKTIEFFDSLM